MFGVGGPRCKKKFASRAATLRCRPRTTYYHVVPNTTTHVLPRTIVQAERSFCISDSQPQTSAAKFLHLGQPTADIGRKVFASRTASPACRPAFWHVGRMHPVHQTLNPNKLQKFQAGQVPGPRGKVLQSFGSRLKLGKQAVPRGLLYQKGLGLRVLVFTHSSRKHKK